MSQDTVLAVWDVTNAHFESLLKSAGKKDVKDRAEETVATQIEQITDLVEMCKLKLTDVSSYLTELYEEESHSPQTQQRDTVSPIAGSWSFLYTTDSKLFGFMKMMQETVRVGSRDGMSVMHADFTLPRELLKEIETVHSAGSGSSRSYVSCHLCQLNVRTDEYWKHALMEIIEKGNTVPAWQPLEGHARWTVVENSGWCDPIYRFVPLENVSLVETELNRLNVARFFSETHFTQALDDTLRLLTVNLERE